MEFKGTIVITDPCYLDIGLNTTEDLWEKSGYGEDLSVLGCSQWISEDTIYGDWDCFTYKGKSEDVIKQIKEWNYTYMKFLRDYNDPNITPEERDVLLNTYKTNKARFLEENTLGEFCADAGKVCVVYLKEILKVNPEFKEWAKTHQWCVTIIENFDGDVTYEVDENTEAHIVGKGNINFYTSQSGL